MDVVKLIGQNFFRELEKDVVAAVGISLSKNGKIVTARTVQSVRAVTVFNGDQVEIAAYGGEGLPFIIEGKPANTKLPVNFIGTEKGSNGRDVKVFELKQHIKDWKAIVGFGGSDFLLARAIAKNPRPGVDIATDATEYINKKVIPKIAKKFGSSLLTEIINPLDNE